MVLKNHEIMILVSVVLKKTDYRAQSTENRAHIIVTTSALVMSILMLIIVTNVNLIHALKRDTDAKRDTNAKNLASQSR